MRVTFSGSMLALVLVGASSALLACGGAPEEDVTSTAEVEEALTAADTLLARAAAELSPSSFESSTFRVTVDETELDFVSVSVSELSSAWNKRIERARRSLEQSGDPERPARLADLLDVYRVERDGKVIGYTASFGMFQSWRSGRCTEDCASGPSDYGMGERHYFNARRREVARSEWEN